MTIKLELSEQTEAQLLAQARVTGVPIEAFVRDAVEEKLAAAAGAAAPGKLTAEQRVRVLDEWVASHPARPGVKLDDTRESIYAGRGE
jgi:hypothetical protein